MSDNLRSSELGRLLLESRSELSEEEKFVLTARNEFNWKKCLLTGQKFAILAEKTVLSAILRKYEVQSLLSRQELIVVPNTVLVPKTGIKLRLTPRRTAEHWVDLILQVVLSSFIIRITLLYIVYFKLRLEDEPDNFLFL